MSEDHKLHVTVHFPAAEEPFQDPHVDRSETVGHLKARVLTAFGLVEGTLPDGNIAAYTLYHEKKPLEDSTQTLGDIAGHHKALQLKLTQQITQGR
jgi:hypothetical protein